MEKWLSIDVLRDRVNSGDFQCVCQELRSRLDKGPEEWYLLGVALLHAEQDNPEEAIRCFSEAETSGFDPFWVAFFRSRALFAVGDDHGVVRDALTVLATKYDAGIIDLMMRSLRRVDGESDNRVASAIAVLYKNLEEVNRRILDCFSVRSPRIIKVRRPDFEAFTYEGDYTGRDLIGPSAIPSESLTPASYIATYPHEEPHLLLLAHYLAVGLKPAFLDIGANLGTDSILAALLMRCFGIRIPIAAFEPGVLRDLLPYTLKLNGLQDEVKAEMLAVSGDNCPAIMFGERGASVNARLVNRDATTETVCHLVDCVTVDTYVAQGGLQDYSLVIKIDTQGAEWLIWQGLRPLVRRQSVSMLMEFAPFPLQSSVDPVLFVKELCDHFHVVDVGASRDRADLITAGEAASAVEAVKNRDKPWTDFVCIGHSVSGADNLLKSIIHHFS